MTETDFFAEIVDSPDEDAPRLVFADWLEERGDPRGELIRVQCELADRRCSLAIRGRLLASERALLARCRPLWLGPLCIGRMDLRFDRGTPDALAGDTSYLSEQMDDIFAQLPMLQSLRITSSRVASCAQAVYALATIERPTHLRSIQLSDGGLDSRDLALLASSAHLAAVERIDLSWNLRIGDDGIAALAHSSSAGNLQELDLRGVPFGAEGARALVESNMLGSLRLLIISNSQAKRGRRRSLRSRFGSGFVTL